MMLLRSESSEGRRFGLSCCWSLFIIDAVMSGTSAGLSISERLVYGHTVSKRTISSYDHR